MRKIEMQLIEAIKAKTNFNKDNTSLSFIPQTDNEWMSVKLHGNEIIRIYSPSGKVQKVEISHYNWLTNTTKSRLNAIVKTFCFNECHGIYQKKGEWFIDFKHKQIKFDYGFYQIVAD